MPSSGCERWPSASRRLTISAVAPPSANIGPAASASSLSSTPESSSRSIILAILAMVVRGIILYSPVPDRLDYNSAQQRIAAAETRLDAGRGGASKEPNRCQMARIEFAAPSLLK